MPLPTTSNRGLRLILISIWLGAFCLPWRSLTDRSAIEFVGALLLLDYCLLWVPFLMFSRRPWRARLGRVLLVSASLAGLVILSEGLMLARVVDYRRSEFAPGDVLVVALNNSNLRRPPKRAVTRVGELRVVTGVGVSTMSSGAGFYSSTWGPFPFALGASEPERYRLFEVRESFRFSGAP